MLTCIINQFDCSEGTKGKAFCISIGKVKLENPEIINKIGAEIEPNKRLFVFDSINKWIEEMAQLKKISDS